MPGDTTPWLTTDDLGAIFQLRDRRATATLAHRLGGVKIGGRWRVPPDAIDALRADPVGVGLRPTADHPSSARLSSPLSRVPDPSDVPDSLGTDWWKDSA